MTPTIRLKPIEEYEPEFSIPFTFALLKERPSDANISHEQMPTMEQHANFVLSHPYRAWLVVENNYGAKIGTVVLTENNEVGVQIMRGWQRQGFARLAVRAAMLKYEPLPSIPSVRRGRYIANINPRNSASIALFEGIGGKLIQHTYLL